MQKHNQTNRICYNLLTLNKVGTILYHFPESSSKTWCKINHIASHCVFCWCETLTWEQTTQVCCCSLRWRQNGRHSVSNHQPHDCLFNRLFRRRSKKHQSSASLAFVWGIHRDRWIPRTKGQLRGKCFHLMTSSWLISMIWYRQAIFESKGDKLSSSAECRIRTQGPKHQIASRLNASWKTDWTIEDQAKTWIRQPVPVISKHSAHSTPLSVGFRTWF